MAFADKDKVKNPPYADNFENYFNYPHETF